MRPDRRIQKTTIILGLQLQLHGEYYQRTPANDKYPNLMQNVDINDLQFREKHYMLKRHFGEIMENFKIKK